MRTPLTIAGLLVGTAAAFAPVSPAAAQCDPRVSTGSGCSNVCTETGHRVDAATAGLREMFATIPSYWDLVSCTQ